MGNCQGNSAEAPPAPDRNHQFIHDNQPKHATCPICFENKVLQSHLLAEANEHFNLQPCNHMYCQECFTQYVEGMVLSLKSDIFCPDPGCKYPLSHRDVQNNTTRTVYDKYLEMKSISHLDRFLKNDPKMLKFLGMKEEMGRYKEALKAHAEAIHEWETKEKQAIEPHQPPPPKQSKFVHGTRVRATYLTTNVSSFKYVGTVVEVHANSTMSISYDDGDFWGECPFNCAQLHVDNKSPDVHLPKPSLDKFMREFKVGFSDTQHIPLGEIFKKMRVMAGWRHGSSLYAGTIRSINKKNRTVEINYDDGDYWDACPISTLKDIEAMSVKCCPKCFILIHKAEGCDSMRCVCGHSFSWQNTPIIPKSLLDALLEKEREDALEEGESWTDAKEEEEEQDYDRKLPAPPVPPSPHRAIEHTYDWPYNVGSPGKRRKVASPDDVDKIAAAAAAKAAPEPATAPLKKDFTGMLMGLLKFNEELQQPTAEAA